MIEMILEPTSYTFWLLVIAVIVGAVAIISRPFSTYVKFVYPNAKFEAMGNPFLNEKNLSSIIDSKNLNDFKENLNTSNDYIVSGNTTLEIQQSLDDIFIKSIEMMQNDSSKKMSKFYNIYLQKIDLYLIKKEIKNKLRNNKINEYSITHALLPETKHLLSKLEEANKEDISSILKEYGFNEKIIEIISTEENDYLIIDNLIDRYMIDNFTQVKVPFKCNDGKNQYIRIITDVINIKNILRCKQLSYNKETFLKIFLGEGQEIAKWKYEELADMDGVSQVITGLEGTSYYNILKDSIENYNKEGSVQVLENALDSLFLKLIKEISLKNYSTIGPTIRYLVSKEFEIQNLKIIAKGVGEGISSDIIKPLLVQEVGL